MFLRELKNPLCGVRGISERKAGNLAKLGIISVAELLTRYPKDYEDRTELVCLRDYNKQRNVNTIIKVIDHKSFLFRGETKWKIIIEDQTARAVLPCFFRGNFLVQKMAIGSEFRISGRFEKNKYGELQSTHFEIEGIEDAEDIDTLLPQTSKFGKILPIYYYSDAERNRLLRATINDTLVQYAKHIENELPEHIIEGEKFLTKANAIKAIHFPEDKTELEAAKKTLIYEELFYLEVLVGKRRIKRRTISVNTPSPALAVLQQRLVERLPFHLTDGQMHAVSEINADLDSSLQMARLLQGDVGSGKTLVAFLAALKAAEQGGQTALMAPTELLARQHADNAAALLEPLGIHVAFLTGNIKSSGRKALLKALAAGEINIVVGTHALFSKDVVYKKLSLVIIDEQHRFGVTQRQTIMAKGDQCALLMMSATPIPRTLAMTVFGDMDVSVIHELPKGRLPVITHLASEENENKVYEFVRRHLASGRQAYFVYPLIELNEDLDLKDAETMFERLSKEIFPQWKCALLHSRIDEEVKRTVMENFRRGDIKILVATSVVEVGVDVPNANCMVIEHAERFGLSALHQLRGRVGRGEHQSYCFLIYSRQDIPVKYFGKSPEMLSDEERTKEGRRLMVMLREHDGFKIAEEDLKFRGPGDIAGTEQSGFMRLGLADPVRDSITLEAARNEAFAILEQDPALGSPAYSVIGEVLRRAPPFVQ